MKIQVVTTNKFQRAWKRLTPQMQRIVMNKIDWLVENPGHPSLNAHRLRQINQNIWICYISTSQRLLYEHKKHTLYLWDLGSHSIVDKVHLRKFLL